MNAKWMKRAKLDDFKEFSLKDLQGAYNVLLAHQGAGSHRLTSHADLLRERNAVLCGTLKDWMEAQGIDPSKGRAFLRKEGIEREFTVEALNALREKFL